MFCATRRSQSAVVTLVSRWYPRRVKTPARWALRIALALVVAVGVLLVVVALDFDGWARSFVEWRLRSATGHPVTIGRLSIGLKQRHLTVERFVLYNTPEFGGGPMVDLPELRVELDREALRENKLRFTLLRVNLAEAHLVHAKDGRTNFEELGKRLGERRTERRLAFAGMETLCVTVGRFRHTDLRASETPRDYRLGLENEIVTGIQNEQDLRSKLSPLALKAGRNVLRNALVPPAVKPPGR